MAVLRVRYIGEDLVAMKKGKIYDVIAIESGYYRIMTEIHEDYLFPPKLFEIKVKYVGGWDTLALIKDKVYDVMSVEKGWYRIMTELEEDYLFPPHLFEFIE